MSHSATTGRNADVGRKADVAFEATGAGDDDASTGRAISAGGDSCKIRGLRDIQVS
jgi:hypothetical protein